MSIKKNEKALKGIEQEIMKIRGRIYLLENSEDLGAIRELREEKEYLEELEKRRKKIRLELEKEKASLEVLDSRFESLKASLEDDFNGLAGAFIEKVKDLLEGDLREEFIDIYEQLQGKSHTLTRLHIERENTKGSTTVNSFVPGLKDEHSFMSKVSIFFDRWEMNTRKEMIKRAKMAREAMK